MSKTKADAAAAEINKLFGDGTITVGSKVERIHHWPTGVLPVDHVLDGGLPVGRFVEIFGDYSTLKSYVAYCAMGSVQKMGGTVAIVDSEHSFDKEWAAELGVDVDDMLIQRPKTGEEALSVMEVLIRGGYDLIVWDSIAATQPKQYAEKKPGEDLQPGGQARMMSAGLRRLNSANEHTAILAINQTRVNVGMTYGGARDSMPGGKAMPFYASYRLRFVKGGRVSTDEQIWTGEKMENAKVLQRQKIKVTLEKSKLSAPNREVWFDYVLDGGYVDENYYLLGWAIENGYVQVKGSGVYTMDELTVRGREKFFNTVSENEEVMTWLREQVTEGWALASPGSPK